MSDDPRQDQLSAFSRPMYKYFDDAKSPLGRPEPTARELSQEYVAPGTPAQYPVGLLYRADHETLDDGMCRQARLHASALGAAGIPVRLQSVSNRVRHGDEWYVAGEDMLRPEVLDEVGHLRKTSIEYAGVIVIHAVIWEAMGLWRLALPVYAQREGQEYVDRILRRTIVFMPWERTTVSEDLVRGLNLLGQVWVACRANAAAMVSNGVEPKRVHVVPAAYDPTGIVCQVPNRRMAAPSGRRFYNIGKWEPRKGQHELFGAFMLGFGPQGDGTLTVKTHGFGSWDGYPTGPEDSVRQWLEDPRVRAKGWRGDNVGQRVRFEERVFTDQQIAKLHEINNIYVAPSHGEQWDYPAFDAVAVGNRLVHVGYGGSEDFAPPSTIQLPWHFGPIHPGYPWEPNAQWAHFSLEDLVKAMIEAEPLPVRQPPAELDRYTKKSAGARMRELVLRLADETGVTFSGVER